MWQIDKAAVQGMLFVLMTHEKKHGNDKKKKHQFWKYLEIAKFSYK